MGEKYSPEQLEALRSVGFNKGGRTKHNHAGVPIEKTAEIRDETSGELVRKTMDHNNAVVTERQDGSQDVNLHPKAVEATVNLTSGQREE